MKITRCPWSRNCREDFLGEAHWRSEDDRRHPSSCSPGVTTQRLSLQAVCYEPALAHVIGRRGCTPSSPLKVQANPDDFTLWRALHSWAWCSRRWDGVLAARRPCLLPVLHLKQGWTKRGTTNPAAQQQPSPRSRLHAQLLTHVVTARRQTEHCRKAVKSTKPAGPSLSSSFALFIFGKHILCLQHPFHHFFFYWKMVQVVFT